MAHLFPTSLTRRLRRPPPSCTGALPDRPACRVVSRWFLCQRRIAGFTMIVACGTGSASSFFSPLWNAATFSSQRRHGVYCFSGVCISARRRPSSSAKPARVPLPGSSSRVVPRSHSSQTSVCGSVTADGTEHAPVTAAAPASPPEDAVPLARSQPCAGLSQPESALPGVPGEELGTRPRVRSGTAMFRGTVAVVCAADKMPRCAPSLPQPACLVLGTGL